MLLRHGADVNATTGTGRTPLHAAAHAGAADYAAFLIEQGADPTLEDREGCTAYDLATELGHDDVADVLSQHDAETEAPAG